MSLQAPRVSWPVPSRSLLRYLRLQTDVAFFRPSHVTASKTCRRAPLPPLQSKTSTRLCRHRATPLEASLVDTESLFKRLSNARRLAPLLRSSFSTSRPTRKLTEPDAAQAAHARSWQERLWGASARKGSTPLQPNDLPDHDDTNDPFAFNNRRSLAAKAALEPRLRCTEVDESGNVILVDGEFKKTELIAKVNASSETRS